jgi:hypothetical protein
MADLAGAGDPRVLGADFGRALRDMDCTAAYNRAAAGAGA